MNLSGLSDAVEAEDLEVRSVGELGLEGVGPGARVVEVVPIEKVPLAQPMRVPCLCGIKYQLSLSLCGSVDLGFTNLVHLCHPVTTQSLLAASTASAGYNSATPLPDDMYVTNTAAMHTHGSCG